MTLWHFFFKVKKLTRIIKHKVFSSLIFIYLFATLNNTLNCLFGIILLTFCKEDKKGQKEPHVRSLNTHTNGARGRKSLLLCRTARPSSRVPSSSKSSTTGAPSAAAAADKIITVIHTRIPLTTNVIMRKEKRECEDLHLDLLQRLSRRRRILTTLKREERREWSKTPPCSWTKPWSSSWRGAWNDGRVATRKISSMRRRKRRFLRRLERAVGKEMCPSRSSFGRVALWACTNAWISWRARSRGSWIWRKAIRDWLWGSKTSRSGRWAWRGWRARKTRSSFLERKKKKKKKEETQVGWKKRTRGKKN